MKSNRIIGILGGGQLARMSLFAAYRMGFECAILEKEKGSPAGMLTKNEFVGSVEDDNLLKSFADASDVITLENEFIDSVRLSFLENTGKRVIPSSHTISLIQDKFIQKCVLKKHGIPVPEFLPVKNDSNYYHFKIFLGEKFLIKSRKMGYDGYGNYVVSNANDFDTGIKKLSSRHSELMVEEFIDFEKELAVMVVRTKKEFKVYPVVETIQKDNVCFLVKAPAKIREKLNFEIKEISYEILKAINGYGIFGIEMFLTKKGKILVNELAPRPHNSGHYTIEGCVTSQFENHIRSVLNLPLGSTEMIKKYAVMINILGKRNSNAQVENYDKILKEQDAHLHIYGKKETRIRRKMGHLTIIGNNLDELIKKSLLLEKRIII